MDNMANLAEVRRERGIFLAGSCLLVIGLPLGMWGLARELLMSGSALARYWEPVGYPVAAAVMHGSAVYFVWRLSSFLREPRCRTGLWSVLAFVVVPFYLIPAVALLVKAQRSEKKLVDAKIEVINTELHGFLLTEPTESQIIEWVRQRGFHLIEPDPYAFQFNAELGFRDSAAGPPPFCYDFRSPELRRILRVGRGPEDRTLPGQAIGDIQHAVPDSLRETYAHHKRAEELERRGELKARPPQQRGQHDRRGARNRADAACGEAVDRQVGSCCCLPARRSEVRTLPSIAVLRWHVYNGI
ncbi:MAG: hypothetical protein GX131_20480 [candidate division WS1 bacterium]|jgi:hypothetical protein|nr:hypothetical protein [candidate division WS1 bacterium]